MTKKERAEGLISTLKELGVQNIATGTHPKTGGEEIVINFGRLPNSNVDNTQFNYSILDDCFIIFIGPLYKCQGNNLGKALYVVNQINQQPLGKFYIDDNGYINMKQMDFYINNSQQLAGEFVKYFQQVLTGDFIKYFKDNLD